MHSYVYMAILYMHNVRLYSVLWPRVSQNVAAALTEVFGTAKLRQCAIHHCRFKEIFVQHCTAFEHKGS